MVVLTHYMWHQGEIPTELVWTILVLIPKGNTDLRGIILLETLWKVKEVVILLKTFGMISSAILFKTFQYHRGLRCTIPEVGP